MNLHGAQGKVLAAQLSQRGAGRARETGCSQSRKEVIFHKHFKLLSALKPAVWASMRCLRTCMEGPLSAGCTLYPSLSSPLEGQLLQFKPSSTKATSCLGHQFLVKKTPEWSWQFVCPNLEQEGKVFLYPTPTPLKIVLPLLQFLADLSGNIKLN